MKQLIQNLRTGRLQLLDVPAPQVQPGRLLVSTSVSLISAGTERMIVDFANKTLVGKAQSRPDLVRKVINKARRDGIAATFKAVMARLDQPLPLGYSASGRVMAVGSGLEGSYAVGQRVAIAGAGIANHAEFSSVPAPLAAAVPDDVSDEEAAFGTVAAIALHGIRVLGTGLGDTVAVVGVGLVGLLATQLLALSGARVVALDVNPERLAVARRLGAEAAFVIGDVDVERSVETLTGGRGVDGILIAAAAESNEPLILAAAIARDRARVSLVGKIGTEFPFAEFMKKELSLTVSRSYGPGRYDDAFETGAVKYPVGFVRWTETENLAECLRLMSPSLSRRLIVDPLITHRFDLAQSEAAYDLILNQRAPHLGVLLRYSPTREPSRRTAFLPPPAAGQCVIGVIGAGAFASAVLLPALAKVKGIERRIIATTRGMTAEHARERYGFSIATTDAEEVFADPAVNAVMVLSRPESHASLVCRALAAGKAVFVEKPLALSREELARIIEARHGSDHPLAVGFNRRFAPFTVAARRRLQDLPGPRMVIIRVNAGPSTAGDRILGEVCHFVDLARYLVNAPIASVHAVSTRVDGQAAADDVTTTLAFADGSLGTIVYTGLGDSSFAKENVEIYAAGSIIRIDDFRTLTVVAQGRTTVERARLGQDKGHDDEVQAFVDAVTGRGAFADELAAFESSLATIAILESLQRGGRIDL